MYYIFVVKYIAIANYCVYIMLNSTLIHGNSILEGGYYIVSVSSSIDYRVEG